MLATALSKVRGYYIRNSWRYLYRRPLTIQTDRPVISFTFDDFPRSAISVGGAMLERAGYRGTYFASLGLMGTTAPTGQIFLREDLDRVVENGHELGCHTFDHSHSWDTAPHVFDRAVTTNQTELDKMYPGLRFKTFSYPISLPRLKTKRLVVQHFLGCRGGGQTFNIGTVDRGCLSAFFLEKSRDNLAAIKSLIDRNRDARGWLILATHDVSDSPTPYGVTPALFEAVLQASIDSGARILTMADAIQSFPAS